MSRRIGVGDSLPVDELARWLLERGMQRAEVVEVPGEFSSAAASSTSFRPTPPTRSASSSSATRWNRSARSTPESQRSLDRWDNVTLTIPPSYDEQNRRRASGRRPSFFPERHLGGPGRAGRPA